MMAPAEEDQEAEEDFDFKQNDVFAIDVKYFSAFLTICTTKCFAIQHFVDVLYEFVKNGKVMISTGEGKFKEMDKSEAATTIHRRDVEIK